jgi:DNA-binding CsgD family transcriptional regulator/tetratricopeptide (TPR) repeat protein
MLDALYELTEGNPFFLEEVLKALMVAGELVESEDGWRWKRADTWHIPLSLHNAVELRLTHLSSDGRRVLQLAAVTGRRFDFALLQKITGYNESYLVELMKEAIAAQLVVEESAEQFAFRHALTQQAIASGLLARERRILHGTIAEALQLARELEWAAGIASAEVFFGSTLASFGQLGTGLEHVQQGLHLAVEMNHQQWIAGAHYSLANIYVSLLAPEQTLVHAEIGLKAARALGSAIWITHLIAVQVRAYAALGQPELAEAALQEVQQGAERPRQTAERSLLLVWAELALAQQRPDLALQRCEQLLATTPQRAGETPERVIPRLWKCQGEALAALGREEEAIRVLEEARRGAKLQQYLPLLWQIERSLGRVYQKQRRLEEAQQAFASARRGIALLSGSIEDPALRSHFEQTAYAMLPKEKLVSPRRATADEYDGLSEREREVAALIGQGKSNAEMAELLVVSRWTVETYVSRVLSKLGLTSRSQIALWTRDKGMVSRKL